MYDYTLSLMNILNVIFNRIDHVALPTEPSSFLRGETKSGQARTGLGGPSGGL